MAPQTSTRLTCEDYALLPDDGLRHEIVDGEHSVNPAPSSKHQRILLNLAGAMDVHVIRNGLGVVFVAPYDVVMSQFALGVAEYWIIDPEGETVKIHRRTTAGLAPVETPEPLETPLIPGFTTAKSALFRLGF